MREFIYFDLFDEHWKDLGLSDDDVVKLENFLIDNPKAGKVIIGTGGLRKLRFELENTGKRGGARVLYVDFAFCGKTLILDVYGKGNKADITMAERNEYRRLLTALRKFYEG